jgi:predicted Zn-dependent protease with MMP-like domain
MIEMDADAFDALVSDELDLLPDEMLVGLDNVVFVVEDRPDGSLDLLGLYDGLALTERDRYGVGELPDRIVYREPHLHACDDESQLRDEVHTTLVHEIAHFYGIDDARLHELVGHDAVPSRTWRCARPRRRRAVADGGLERSGQPHELRVHVPHLLRHPRACRAPDARAPRGPRGRGRGAREQMELHVQAMHDYGSGRPSGRADT